MPYAPDIAFTLHTALEQSESPVALYDAADMLRHANPAYESAFLKGLSLPVPFAEVLRHGFRHGFGVHIGSGDIEAFLADILPRRRSTASRTVLTDTVDGRWLQFTETLLPDGWLVTLATDITALKQHERMITMAHDHAVHAALTDPLTGVPNRRHILELAERAMSARRAADTPVSFALIDIDHFKRINDSLGHHGGDEVLKAFCAACPVHLRPSDHLGRIGGEEFLLVLPGAAAPVAVAVVERLRDGVRQATGRAPYTFSAGIAEPWPGERLESTLRRADAALYAAKRDGRDQSVVAPPSVTP